MSHSVVPNFAPASPDDIKACPFESIGSAGTVYRIEDVLCSNGDLLGRGTQGMVFKGWDTRTNQVVAVKMGESKLASVVESFEVEVLSLSELQHPFIPRLHRHGRAENGDWFEVLEYVPRKIPVSSAHFDESEVNLPTTLNCEDATRLLIRCAEALGYAHNLGILHGDVRPPNIGLSTELLPKLLDWGSALAISGGAAIKLLPARKGILTAPAFSSLGAILGDPANLKMDIHSLAATGFVLIFGRLPFLGPEIRDLHRQLQLPVEAPPEMNDQTTAAVFRVLQSAMHPDKSVGPATMNDFARMLHEALSV